MSHRWQLTSHAVDRYLERIAPDLGDRARAELEMRAALGSGRRDREAERTVRGQVIASEPPILDHRGRRRGQRELAHFIVIPPPGEGTRGRHVVVSCWPSGFAGDLAAELTATSRRIAEPPSDWRDPDPIEQTGEGWGALVGKIEVARRRSLAYQAQIAAAPAMRALLVDLAAAGGDVADRIAAEFPDIVESGRLCGLLRLSRR